ncbi:MAG: sulfotransferase [Sphingomonadales bacterium]|nr:sulfotransferase [Sphingomonadales bacterium]
MTPAAPPGGDTGLDSGFEYYQVDPRLSRRDRSGRYPANFVRFPWYLRLIGPASRLPALASHRLLCLSEHLPPLFDRVQPGADWGTAEQIARLRDLLLHYCRGIDDNPHISAVGRLMIGQMARGYLIARARTVRFFDEHRDFILSHGRFKAPLIVTGFPRTGTTLLQRLLSEDPATRAPFTFELERPVPPMRSGDDPLADPRIALSEDNVARLRRFAPGLIERFAQSHPYSPTAKEESLLYVQLHHGLQFLSAASAGRSYFHAINRPEVADGLFAYERNLFTLMDAFRPAASHWTLKAPAYAPYFGKLFEHYPDARVVVTHRHPGRNFASVCRLLETSVLPFDRPGAFDKHRFAALLQDTMRPFLSAPLDWRAAHPEREGQIIDCHYTDLMRDPVATVRRIYAHFGLAFSAGFEARMRAWLSANPQGRQGRHSYSNAEYGIDPQALYQANRAYYARHGFQAEPGAAD